MGKMFNVVNFDVVSWPILLFAVLAGVLSFPLVELGKHFACARSDWVRGSVGYPLMCIGFICVAVFVYVFVKFVFDVGSFVWMTRSIYELNTRGRP